MRTFRARLEYLWRRALARLRRAPSRVARERDPLGPAGERAAEKHLRREGYRIVGRNMRLRAGEIDLLALDPGRRTLVVVEVKCRRCAPGAAGVPARPAPEASVTNAKKRKLLSLARAVSSRRRWRRLGVRIDIVGIDWPEGGAPLVRHHVNAVTR